MIILAIDPATKCGFCAGVPGSKPTLGTVNFGGREHDDHPDIFARALTWFGLQFSPSGVMGQPDVVAIEEPVAPWQVQGETQWATTQIALGLQAIAKAQARKRGIKIIGAPIKTWRKYTLGIGNLKGADAKERMLKLVYQLRFVPRGEQVTHDAAEAAGIWLWCCGQINPRLAQRPEPLFAGRPSREA
jgi:hypothetical protein